MTPTMAAVVIGAGLVAGFAVGGWLLWQARPRRPRTTTEEAYTELARAQGRVAT